MDRPDLGGAEAWATIAARHVDAGVLVTAPESTILFANDRAAELLGVSRARLVGERALGPALRLVDADGQRLHARSHPFSWLQKSSQASLRAHDVGVVHGQDGRITRSRITVAPILDDTGALQAVVLTLVDLAPSPPPPGPTRADLHAVVVDDQPAIGRVLVRALEAEGLSVEVHADGEHLLARLAEERVDLLFLDVSLPGRSGNELLKDLRKTHPALPVVLMSGYVDGRDPRARRDAEEPTRFLSKPFRIDTLREVLEQLLG